jgi:hypothetical protein
MLQNDRRLLLIYTMTHANKDFSSPQLHGDQYCPIGARHLALRRHLQPPPALMSQYGSPPHRIQFVWAYVKGYVGKLESMDGREWQLEVDGRRKWPDGERLSGNIDLRAIADSKNLCLRVSRYKLKKRSIALQRAVRNGLTDAQSPDQIRAAGPASMHGAFVCIQRDSRLFFDCL